MKIRFIRPDEAEQAAEIERICFPPNEACSHDDMIRRVAAVPRMFTVAEDETTGKLAGFINGLATNETSFRDEFFTDPGLNEPDGKQVMILGLDVLPEYRHQGVASALMRAFLRQAEDEGRHFVLLTCHEAKIGMYEHMGFKELGLSHSVWGGVQWREMICDVRESLSGGEPEIVPRSKEERKLDSLRENPDVRKEKSCGAVVYRTVNHRTEFLLEHMVQGHTSIPKGHVEDGETEEETALREIREETNLDVRLDTNFRHVITYSPAAAILKDVVFFVAEAKPGKMINQECEVTSLEWLPYEQAIAALTHASDRQTLEAAWNYLNRNASCASR